MEREIKFRAWDEINKRMIYPHYRSFSDILSNGDILDRWVNIMQYTGLKDKNSREIYEGDILNGLNRINKIVKWSDEGACFVEEEQFDPVCIWSFDMLLRKHKKAFAVNCILRSHFIIGNIYENPELI